MVVFLNIMVGIHKFCDLHNNCIDGRVTFKFLFVIRVHILGRLRATCLAPK